MSAMSIPMKACCGCNDARLDEDTPSHSIRRSAFPSRHFGLQPGQMGYIPGAFCARKIIFLAHNFSPLFRGIARVMAMSSRLERAQLLHFSQHTLGEITGRLPTLSSASSSASPVTKQSTPACNAHAIIHGSSTSRIGKAGATACAGITRNKRNSASTLISNSLLARNLRCKISSTSIITGSPITISCPVNSRSYKSVHNPRVANALTTTLVSRNTFTKWP